MILSIWLTKSTDQNQVLALGNGYQEKPFYGQKVLILTKVKGIASVLNDIKLFSLDFEHLNYLGSHATRVCFQSLVWQSSRSFRAVLSSLIPASLALDQSCNIWVIFSTCVVNQWSWWCIVVDDSPFIGVSLILGGLWFTDLLIERSGYEPSEPSQGLCCDLRQDTLQKTVDGY